VTDILGYRGKRVAIVGCYSGTGEACARTLVELGAEVHGADVRPSPVEGLATFTQVDLTDQAAILAGVAAIGGEIDALFNVSGLPQTFPGEDVVTVNFLGMRLWTETWVPRIRKGGAIVTVSSLAGMGHLGRQPLLKEFMDHDIAGGRAWYTANAERAGDPYSLSKEAICTWTMQSAPALMERDIRINCTMPSPIDTPMLGEFRKTAGDAVLSAFAKAKGRYSTAEEQALPLILLNSDAASFVSGTCLPVDAGLSGGLSTGVLNLQQMIAEAKANA
jgi:NAD(P)-dependent dehydrogenase (short-subunit alcohol dehydrogenase family)